MSVRRLVPLLSAVALTVAVAVPGVILALWNAALKRGDARLHPWLERAISGSAIAVAAVAVLAAVLVVTGRAGAALGRARRAVYVAVEIVVALGLLAAILFADFPIFDAAYLGVHTGAPDGGATAYLYSQELFCGYTIYVRRHGSPILHRRDAITVRCADRPKRPRLAWTDAPRVLDDRGEPVGDHPIYLDFSPR